MAFDPPKTDEGSRLVTELGGINTCGNTSRLDHAAETLKDLGPGRKPKKATS